MTASIDLPALFARQRAARARVAALDHRQRGRRLLALERALLARRSDAYAALAADLGKPPEEVDATELYPVVTELRHARRHLRRWMRRRSVPAPLPLIGSRSSVEPIPLGAALVLAPWNFPLNLTLGPVTSALAAGCTVTLKPSELAPRTGAFVAELLGDLFPEDEVAVVEGAAEVARALTELPFDKVFFTGSPRVGRLVARAAAEHLTPVTLELGGRAPAIVAAGADVATAAEALVRGKFTNAGQICIAPNHVLVDARRADDLVAALTRTIERRFGRTPAERRTSRSYGRIVSEDHHRRLVDLLDGAVARGAQIAIGGEHDLENRYLGPTVLADLAADDPVVHEELFGPLLPIVAVGDLEEALGHAGADDAPLAVYGFGDRRERRQIAAATRAGATVLGTTLIHFGNPHLPFGGVGASGYGRCHGRAGFEAFTARTAHLEVHRRAPLVDALAPPYGDRARRLLDLALRWF